MKTTYEERATKFITTLLVKILANARTLDELSSALLRYNFCHKRPLKWTNGATRIVIIRSDYVVKIAYCNRYGDNMSEYRGYEFAKANHYEYLFAKPTLITIGNHVFEIMPRVAGVGNWHKSWEMCTTREEYRFIDNHYLDLHEYNLGYHNGKPVFIDYALNEVR